MIAGSKKKILLILCIILFNSNILADDKILSSPLINLDKLKPSFEEVDNTNDELINNEMIKNKKIIKKNKSSGARLIGLDKITAKTSEININLGETKKFGPLEIKVLKCGKVNSKNITKDSVAYLQVKDLSVNQNEKVFIFNGWTFSSDSTLTPFDHAIYDLQLINCYNV